jgi:hypothetical protein
MFYIVFFLARTKYKTTMARKWTVFSIYVYHFFDKILLNTILPIVGNSVTWARLG